MTYAQSELKKARKERADAMVRLYQSGLTLEQIGVAYGLTRERVRQIISRGEKHVGGPRLAAFAGQMAAARERARLAEERTLTVYGCHRSQAIELNGGAKPSTPYSRCHRYVQQRKNAEVRGISWNITFPEWCRVWAESGKEHLRGRGANSYVMSRFGDSGAYEVGNVEIITQSENARDSYLAHPHSERFPQYARDENGLTAAARRLLESAKRHNGNAKRIAAELGLTTSTVYQRLSTLRTKGLLPRPCDADKAA